MGIQYSGLWLWVILGFAALVIAIAKPGKNTQAVRAVAVVGIVGASFWLTIVALGWAILDIVLPGTQITVSRRPSKKR